MEALLAASGPSRAHPLGDSVEKVIPSKNTLIFYDCSTHSAGVALMHR